MSMQPLPGEPVPDAPPTGQHHELPVEELLRRARPLPSLDVLVIDDLTDEESAAFLAALDE
ncbi:MAG: hypothetical protein JWO68_3868 [Actinomycetia bacterium]|nr:hypothetical protein [Actinomycetes bacterium]